MSMCIKSAEEDKRRYIEAMGEELGLLYAALLDEFMWLCTKWKEYLQLFGSRNSTEKQVLRLAIVRQSAWMVLEILDEIWWNDIVLHISRLTDPPASSMKPGEKENLTICRLTDLIKKKPRLVAGINKIIESTKKKRKLFLDDWRNRYIAHRDLNLALNPELKPLASASRADVQETLDAVGKVLNIVRKYFMDGTMDYDMNFKYPGGISQLLRVLDDGLQAERERMKRFDTGEQRPEDYYKERNWENELSY